jgi:hypothetical protein
MRIEFEDRIQKQEKMIVNLKRRAAIVLVLLSLAFFFFKILFF